MTKTFSFAIGEYASLLISSKAKKMTPGLEECMFEKRSIVRVRSQAMSLEGDFVMEFNIIKENNQIHVLNEPSPRVTVSLSIAKYLITNYIN